jgi:hypothetical protein
MKYKMKQAKQRDKMIMNGITAFAAVFAQAFGGNMQHIKFGNMMNNNSSISGISSDENKKPKAKNKCKREEKEVVDLAASPSCGKAGQNDEETLSSIASKDSSPTWRAKKKQQKKHKTE